MKKKLLFCLTLLLASLLAIICIFKFSNYSSLNSSLNSSSKEVKATVLIDKRSSTKDFQLKLYYADSSMQQLKSFLLTPDGLHSNEEDLAAYTEGFLPKAENERLLNAVNAYRQKQDLAPLTYFYHYQSIEDFAFVSSSEGLDALYFIDLNTLKVSSPHLKSKAAYENQYVYHIQKVNESYYILTAGFNELTARLYTFSPSTLDLTQVGELITDSTALSANQYVLDASGNALVTHQNGIETLSFLGQHSLSLPFTPQQLRSPDDFTYALAVQNEKLVYALIDHQLNLVDTSSLTLPNAQLSLIDSFVKDNMLYTITYDPNHPVYRHYLTVHDLLDKTLIFCVALSDYDGLALLKTQLLP